MTAPGLPLTLDLYEEIESRLRRLRDAWGIDAPSEYAFSNLYFFRHAHHYRYFPGDYPCIAGITYDGARHLLPLFEPNEVRADILARWLEGGCLYPLPARAMTAFDRERFDWDDLASDADYIYPAENFRAYRGALLRKKDQLMRGLLSEYRLEVRPLSDATESDARAVLAGWMADKNKREGEADDAACTEALQLHRHFGLDGYVYYAEGVAAGFIIAQPHAPGVAVMRFAKGRDAYAGIYQYMFHHYCMSRKEHLAWLNFEQDLGLPHFRQTKRSYQPSSMLRKYRVSARS